MLALARDARPGRAGARRRARQQRPAPRPGWPRRSAPRCRRPGRSCSSACRSRRAPTICATARCSTSPRSWSRAATICRSTIPTSIRPASSASISRVAAEHRHTLMDRMTHDLAGAAARARLIVLGKPIPGVRERLPAGVPVLDVTAAAGRGLSGRRDRGPGRGGVSAGGLPPGAAADAARPGAAPAGDPVPLQPAALADDPRRRAHRLASARVPARARPRGRFRHPDRAWPHACGPSTRRGWRAAAARSS